MNEEGKGGRSYERSELRDDVGGDEHIDCWLSPRISNLASVGCPGSPPEGHRATLVEANSWPLRRALGAWPFELLVPPWHGATRLLADAHMPPEQLPRLPASGLGTDEQLHMLPALQQCCSVPASTVGLAAAHAAINLGVRAGILCWGLRLHGRRALHLLGMGRVLQQQFNTLDRHLFRSSDWANNPTSPIAGTVVCQPYQA